MKLFYKSPWLYKGNIVILRLVQPGKLLIFPKFWLTVCNRMVNETSCFGIVAKNADCGKLMNVYMFCRGPSVSSEHLSFVSLPGKSHGQRSLVGCSPWGSEESDTTELLHFHALEKEMATHSSVLAWRIPRTEEPGGLPSMGSHRVRHD